jgi:hypothetical protein
MGSSIPCDIFGDIAALESCLNEKITTSDHPNTYTDGVVAADSMLDLPADSKIYYGVLRVNNQYYSSGGVMYEHEADTCFRDDGGTLRCERSPYYLNDGGGSSTKAWVCRDNCPGGIYDVYNGSGDPTSQPRSLAAMTNMLTRVFNDPEVLGSDPPPVPPAPTPPPGSYLAPEVTTLENNTANCPGTQQYFTATDGNGVTINWTYTNDSYPCVRVTYHPVTTAVACDFTFYVPKGYATANVRFDIWYQVDGVVKKGSVWLDENPVDNWQLAFRMTNVVLITFQDNNGQPYQSAQIGWGATAAYGMQQNC